MSEDQKPPSRIGKSFDFFVGCAQIVSTVVGIIALIISFVALIWAVRNPNAMPQIIQVISGGSTSTPIVIVLPTGTSMPTYTPAPTYTSYPTIPPTTTAIPPSPTPAIVMTLPFEDTFDIRLGSEWKPILGTWRIVGGQLTADPSKDWSRIMIGDLSWKNYSVDLDIWAQDWYTPIRIIVRENQGGYITYETDTLESYWILVNGTNTTTIASGVGVTRNVWEAQHHIRIEVIDDVYTAYIDGDMLLQVQDNTRLQGRVGLAFRTQYEPTRFDNLLIQQLP